MQQKTLKLMLAALVMTAMLALAGCGGGSGLKRIQGLSPEDTVTTFVNAAKTQKMEEAGLYVSPTSLTDSKAVLKFVTGTSELGDLKNANVLATKKVVEQGNYAVVLVTLQTEQNSFDLTVKPVGLEKIDGEWYIVSFDQIFSNAKYQLLANLLKNVL